MTKMRLLYRYAVLFTSTLCVSFLLIFFFNFKPSSFSSQSPHLLTTQVIDTADPSLVTQGTKTNPLCRYHSCFDVVKCKLNKEFNIKVYVYPDVKYVDSNNKYITPFQNSYEFDAIINALRSSKYATSNPEEACIFVPSIDLLNERGLNLKDVTSILSSLPYWNGGVNHLIFNFFPRLPTPPLLPVNLDVGSAMIASSNIISSNYRVGFDISIPLFNSLTSSQNPETQTAPKLTRRWKLIISQLSILSRQRTVLRQVEDHDAEVVMLRKCLTSPVDAYHYETLCKDGMVFQYPEVLSEGTFCLVLPGRYYGNTLLLDVLMRGCVPVIVMDEYVLPFHDVIDWRLLSVELREHQLPDIVKHLGKFTDAEIAEKRYHGFHAWKRYFSSLGKIVDVVLDVMNERRFVSQKKTYEQWNGAFGSVSGFEKQFGATPPLLDPLVPAHGLGFTAVILTYNRIHMLFILMKSLDKVPSLNKIIIVWNNPYSDPYDNQFPTIKTPWKLVKMKTNSLTNRFYPFDEHIETEAVMAIDDDILMLTPDEIEFAFQTWREYPDRLVGFPARAHTNVAEHELINGKPFKYKYASEWGNELSMVLTGAAMYHKVSVLFHNFLVLIFS